MSRDWAQAAKAKTVLIWLAAGMVILFSGLPMNPKLLRLASGLRSQEIISHADQDFQAVLALVPELDLGPLGNILSEFDLWLRLEMEDTRAAARQQLAAEITDPAKTLQRVRLALAYDISPSARRGFSAIWPHKKNWAVGAQTSASPRFYGREIDSR